MPTTTVENKVSFSLMIRGEKLVSGTSSVRS